MQITGILSRNSPGSWVGSLLRMPLRLLPHDSVMTVRSGLNKGLKWIVGSSIHGCWLGHYEHDKQEVVARLVKPGMHVLDIGANAGFYTLAFSRLVGSSGHVWAFEPLAENMHNLSRHVRLNRIGNATLVQIAVADKTEILAFDVAPSNSMGRISDKEGSYWVPAASIDELISRGLIPLPDLIKLDVEGAESRVLAGAHSLLRRHRTVFLIALHGEAQMRGCPRILKEAGYEVFKLDGRPVATGEDRFVDEIMAAPVGYRWPRPD